MNRCLLHLRKEIDSDALQLQLQPMSHPLWRSVVDAAHVLCCWADCSCSSSIIASHRYHLTTQVRAKMAFHILPGRTGTLLWHLFICEQQLQLIDMNDKTKAKSRAEFE